MPTLFHGTRASVAPGELIQPDAAVNPYVFASPDLDAALWDGELAEGAGPGRVYVVEATGPIEDTSRLPDHTPALRPTMSWRTSGPLRVIREVTQWLHYHGTKADLRVGDFIEPGRNSNFTKDDRALRHVYFTRTLEAARWGAELARGEGRGRIYLVEPTGPIEDDPNLTDKRFRGNPTKSFRSLAPLRVTGEVTEWQGHAPEAIRAMKEGLERLERAGRNVIEE